MTKQERDDILDLARVFGKAVASMTADAGAGEWNPDTVRACYVAWNDLELSVTLLYRKNEEKD